MLRAIEDMRWMKLGEALKVSKIEDIVKSISVDELYGLEWGYTKKIEIKGKIRKSLIEEVSRVKNEPGWMLRLRLKALKLFEKLPMPKWVVGIDEIDLDELTTYVKPDVEITSSWDDLPDNIKKAYEKIGIPELEARFLSGLSAVYGSETIYMNMKKKIEEMGVVILPMEEAVKKYPSILKKYFSRIFPPSDHKFSALHLALWSGGTFVYVPPNVKVPQPIEAFFFIGGSLEGQFEHTLIVADEDSYVHFIEGCSAPLLKKYSFHNGMVELYAKKNSHIKFTTLQNWSKDIINFNNKRGIAESGSLIEWTEGSIGSKITYTYPSTVLRGEDSRTNSVVISVTNGPYLKDTGSKVIHAAPYTRSKILSKSISNAGGLNVYRGLIKINKGAYNSFAHVECDSLILDDDSRAYTYPHNQVEEPSAIVSHEAKTGRLSEQQLFYMGSRGLTEGEAKSLIVIGMLKEILHDLPLEYVSVLYKVIQLEFSELGGIG
jgi:Fe-S cluster assembly protein SufB